MKIELTEDQIYKIFQGTIKCHVLTHTVGEDELTLFFENKYATGGITFHSHEDFMNFCNEQMKFAQITCA